MTAVLNAENNSSGAIRDFEADILRLENRLDSLGEHDPNIDVHFNEGDSGARIDALEKRLDSIDHRNVTATATVEANTAALDRATAQMESFGRLTATAVAAIEANTAALDAASAKVDTFGAKNVNATAGVNANSGSLDALEARLTAFGSLKEQAIADVKTDDGYRSMQILEASLANFGKKVESAKANVDTGEGLTKLRVLEDQFNHFKGETAQARAEVATDKAMADLTAFEAFLHRVGALKITTNVDADTGAATAKITAFGVLARQIADFHPTVRVDADTAGATAQLVSFRAVTQGVSQALAPLSGLIFGAASAWPILAAAIAAVVVLAAPLLAALTGIAAGLTVLGGVLAIAAGGFGLLALAVVPMVKAIIDAGDSTKNLDNAQAKLTDTQTKLSEAVAKYGPESRQAAEAQLAVNKAQDQVNASSVQQESGVQRLIASWNNLKNTFQDTFVGNTGVGGIMADISAKVLDLATAAMPKLGQVAGQVAIAFQGAFNGLLKSLNSPVEQSSVAKLFNAMPPIVSDLTTAIGKFGAGLLNILGQSAGPAQNLAKYLADIADKFLEWTRSEEGRKQIKDFLDTAGPVAKSLAVSIGEIAKALVNVDPKDVKDAAEGIKAIGTAASGAISFIKEVSRAIGEINTTLQPVAGALNSVQRAAETLGASWRGLGSSIASVGASAWESISSGASTAVQAVIGFFQGLPGQIGSILSSIGGAVGSAWEGFKSGASTAVQAVIGFFTGLPGQIGSILSGIGSAVGSAWESIKSGASTAVQGVVGFFQSIPGTIGSIASSIGSTFTAGLQNMASTAGTIVGTIVKFFADLPGNIASGWEKIKSDASATWENLKSTASTAKDAVVGFFTAIPGQVASGWETIKSDASATWENLKSTASTAIDAVVGFFAAIPGQVASAWESIKSAASAAWDWISSTASSMVDAVVGFIASLPANAASAWESIKSAASAAWDWISSTASSMVDAVVGFIASLPDTALSYFYTLRDGAIAAAQALADGVSTAFWGLVDGLKSVGTYLYDNVVKPFQDAYDAIWNHSIVPDLIRDVHGGFKTLPNLIESALKDIPAKISDPFSKGAQAVQDAAKGISGTAGSIGQTALAGAQVGAATPTALAPGAQVVAAGATTPPPPGASSEDDPLAALAGNSQGRLSALQGSATKTGEDLKKNLLGHLTELSDKGSKEFDTLNKQGVSFTDDLQKKAVATHQVLNTQSVALMTDTQTKGTTQFDALNKNAVAQTGDMKSKLEAAQRSLHDTNVASMTSMQTKGTEQFTNLRTNATTQATTMQTGVTNQLSTLQANATTQATTMQNNVTAQATTMQTSATTQATTMQTGVTAQATTMQTGVTAQATTMQTNVGGAMNTMQTDGTAQMSTLQTNGTNSATTMQTDITTQMAGARDNTISTLTEAATQGSAQLETLRNYGTQSMTAADTEWQQPIGDAASGIQNYLNDMLYGMQQVISAASLSITPPTEFEPRLTGGAKFAQGGIVGDGRSDGEPINQDDLRKLLAQGAMGAKPGVTNAPQIHLHGEGDGKEGFLPDNLPKDKALPILREMAGWYGMQLDPAANTHRAPGMRMGGLPYFMPERMNSPYTRRPKTGWGGRGEGLGPTTFDWNAATLAKVTDIEGKFATTANTYTGHGVPGGSDEQDTADFWGTGPPRTNNIDPGVGQAVLDYATSTYGSDLMYWIWQGQEWRYDQGLMDAAIYNGDDLHYDHVHISWFPGGAAGVGTGAAGSAGSVMAKINALIQKDFPAEMDFGASIPGQVATEIGKKSRAAMIAKLGGGSGATVGSTAAGTDPIALIEALFPADAVQKAETIMQRESGGDPNAYNPSGASGLFQIMPSTAAGLGADPSMLFDPAYNVQLAAQLYAQQGWAPWSETAFANGGIALRPQSATIAESGPELVLPLSDPQAARTFATAISGALEDTRAFKTGTTDREVEDAIKQTAQNTKDLLNRLAPGTGTQRTGVQPIGGTTQLLKDFPLISEEWFVDFMNKHIKPPPTTTAPAPTATPAPADPKVIANTSATAVAAGATAVAAKATQTHASNISRHAQNTANDSKKSANNTNTISKHAASTDQTSSAMNATSSKISSTADSSLSAQRANATTTNNISSTSNAIHAQSKNTSENTKGIHNTAGKINQNVNVLPSMDKNSAHHVDISKYGNTINSINGNHMQNAADSGATTAANTGSSLTPQTQAAENTASALNPASQTAANTGTMASTIGSCCSGSSSAPLGTSTSAPTASTGSAGQAVAAQNSGSNYYSNISKVNNTGITTNKPGNYSSPSSTQNVTDSGIPAYATGGIALYPQIAHLAESGPELIMPLDKANRVADFIRSTDERGYDSAEVKQDDLRTIPQANTTADDDRMVSKMHEQNALIQEQNDLLRALLLGGMGLNEETLNKLGIKFGQGISGALNSEQTRDAIDKHREWDALELNVTGGTYR